jgi:peptidylprolyl isomerase
VNYVGVAWSTKKEFDSSWSRGEPFAITSLANAPVIDGWKQGLVGIKQGGRREITIPASLAYADRGFGTEIKPGEALVFVVDAVEVLPPPAG